jgi:hypothetical protein
MKRLLFLGVAVAMVGALCSTASAYELFTLGMSQDVDDSTTRLPLVEIDSCTGCVTCDSACDSCDNCCASGVFFEMELLLLQYLRTEGLIVGDAAGAAEQVPSSLEGAPRISLGYIGADGLGVRARYFEFHHQLEANEALSRLDVDTYTIDTELFERFNLDDRWDLEASFGARYVEFAETMRDQDAALELRHNLVHGFGLIGGVELRRQVCCGAIYGRFRQSILAEDRTRINTGSGTDTSLDTVVGISEINIGYELSRNLSNGSLVYFRVGGEYQMWSNFSSAFDGVTGEAFWDGASDVGFAGLAFTGGLVY